MSIRPSSTLGHQWHFFRARSMDDGLFHILVYIRTRMCLVVHLRLVLHVTSLTLILTPLRATHGQLRDSPRNVRLYNNSSRGRFYLTSCSDVRGRHVARHRQWRTLAVGFLQLQHLHCCYLN